MQLACSLANNCAKNKLEVLVRIAVPFSSPGHRHLSSYGTLGAHAFCQAPCSMQITAAADLTMLWDWDAQHSNHAFMQLACRS